MLQLLISIVGNVCGTLAALAFLGWAVLVVRDRIQLRRFYQTYRGQDVFVGTTRHGWYDFVQNNVVPVLPTSVHIVWIGRETGEAKPKDWSVALRRVGVKGQKPFLLRVTDGRVSVVPLHDELLELRSTAARDKDVQEQVAKILASAFRQESAG